MFVLYVYRKHISFILNIFVYSRGMLVHVKKRK